MLGRDNVSLGILLDKDGKLIRRFIEDPGDTPQSTLRNRISGMPTTFKQRRPGSKKGMRQSTIEKYWKIFNLYVGHQEMSCSEFISYLKTHHGIKISRRTLNRVIAWARKNVK
jgi:hypothetical protein